MDANAAAVLKLVGQKSRVRVIAGSFAGVSGLKMLVNFDNGQVPVDTATPYMPAIDEPVWVMVVDDIPYLLGPTKPKPTDGVVVSTGSNLAVITTAIGDVTATYASGASLTAAQQVKLMWGGELPHVIAVKSTSPVAPPASGGASSAPVKDYTKTFTATGAGSFGASWWTSEVWSSDNNLGAWFYGTKIRDTIPASATIKTVEVYLSAQRISGSPANFGLHGHTSQPGGSPSIGSLTAIAPVNGWLGLPASFGNALRAGGGSYGVGVAHGGFHIFRSLGSDAQSGALRITYRA